MQDVLRALARLFGVAVENDTELRFELSGFPSGGAGLLVLVAAGLALWAVVWFYRRHRQDLSRSRRILLTSLRVLALLLAFLVLFEPNLVSVKRDVRPGHVILLVDSSQSMSHTDSYRRDEVQDLAQAWRSLGVDDPAGKTRLELAKALLQHGGDRALRQLAGKNRLMAYSFGAAVQPLPARAVAGTETTTEGAHPLPDFAELTPDGRHTNPGLALRAALEQSRDASVAAVVLLTDGRRNLGPQGAEAARLLQQRKVPQTLVVPIGDPSEAQTTTLRRADVPERVFQKDPFKITAEVQQQGYPEGDLAVRLLVAMPGQEPQPVQTKSVHLSPAAPTAKVAFEDLSADAAGVYEYTVEVQPPSGEPIVAERHAKRGRVQVLAEQTRVLLLAGAPSPEFRILRDTLIRDKTIDVACWLQSADPEFPQDGDTQLESLPENREDLAPYDVFVFLDPDPRKLSPTFCTTVRDQIDRDGAGLWWIAGEKFTLAAARPEAPTHGLTSLLPVELDLRAADQTLGLGYAYDTAWPWQLTPIGGGLPLSTVADGRDESRLVWERLPGFFWSFPLSGAKPGAAVLVTHGNPRLRGTDGKELPLVAMQPVGTGRVLFTATDETYRWRGLFRTAYERFWVKGVRYLFEGRLRAGGARTRILLAADKVELGDSVRVEVDARNERFEPATEPGLTLRVIRETGGETLLSLAPVEGVPGRYEAMLRPETTGFLRVESADGVSASLQVVRAAVESEGPVDLATLSAIAGIEGGQLITDPTTLAAAAQQIPSMTATDVFLTPYPIWDTWLTVTLLVTVLAIEWWLRKRFNLM
ncbi:MAG: vWA domain-containing protein [Planctomycetota bacterium]